jgi:two-component system NtrC family response regulator
MEPALVGLAYLPDVHASLQELAASGKSLEDLYLRLAVVIIKVPALRERGDDVGLLAKTLHRPGLEHGRPEAAVASDTLPALHLHRWPGNVRELQNRVQRAIILADAKPVTDGYLELTAVLTGLPPQSLKAARENVEREMVLDALRRHRGQITAAARELGISRPTLYALMDKLRIDRD